MKRGKVISILRFFSTIDREIQMNNATIQDLNDRYYITVGAVNMEGLPHGKGRACFYSGGWNGDS